MDGNMDGNMDGSREHSQEEERNEHQEIQEFGQVTMNSSGTAQIHLLSIIGEVEGHENAAGSSKTTKYDHVLPMLAQIEEKEEIGGMLILLNTSGGDVDAGLAIAEMIASLSIPTVSLVLGGSHSIGVPLAVASDYSFIVPTGTMMIHPVRMSGSVIGTERTYAYFQLIQDRILKFTADHCKTPYNTLKNMMHSTRMLTKDLGTVLVGKEAVEAGLIDAVGGISQAFDKLHELMAAEEG